MEQQKEKTTNEVSTGKRIGNFFRKIAIGLVFLLVLAPMGYYAFARFATYSDGSRSGTIIKFSRKGVFFKTYEGQMLLGGIQKGEDGTISSNTFEFSVYPWDDDIAQQIQSAMDSGQRLSLSYRQRYVKVMFWGDEEYFIDKVKLVE